MDQKKLGVLVGLLIMITTTQGAWVTCTAIGAAGTIIGAPFVISTAGFGSAGVTAGSWAAYIQSCLYAGSVPAGGLFASLQSVGAAGLSTLSYLGLGGLGAAISGAVAAAAKSAGAAGSTVTWICTALP